MPRDPTVRERADDTWRNRAKFWSYLVGVVGVPAMLVMGGAVLLGGIVIGKWPAPVVTTKTFEQASRMNGSEHQALVDALKPIGDALKEQNRLLVRGVDALEKITCDVKPTNAKRLECYEQATHPH